MEIKQAHQHFQSGGEAYAHYRPTYPATLAEALAALSPAQRLAVDVGCGTGQLSVLLANHFDQVIATDVSADQLSHATAHPKVVYRQEAAETISVEDNSADLIVAAQAAHWFDLERFYDEVRRIARPDAVLALVSYSVPYLEGTANTCFQQFYWQQTTPFWPAERQHVETGYTKLPFPFETIPTPELAIHREWNIDELMGYIKTWSASRQAIAAGEQQIFDELQHELAVFWGDPNQRRPITWPINLRLGHVR